MHKRDWIEAALTVIGAYLLIDALKQLCDQVLFEAVVWLDIAGGPPSPEFRFGYLAIALRGALGVLLARGAPRLAHALVSKSSRSESTTSESSRSGSAAERGAALELGLQLLGVYVSVIALAALPHALTEFSDTDARTSYAAQRPIAAVREFLSHHHEACATLLQIALGALVAKRAQSIASWLRNARGSRSVSSVDASAPNA